MGKKRRSWQYIYTPQKKRKRKPIRMLLFLICSPLLLPLFLLAHLGSWCETLFEKLDDVIENVTEFIIFKLLK